MSRESAPAPHHALPTPTPPSAPQLMDPSRLHPTFPAPPTMTPDKHFPSVQELSLTLSADIEIQRLWRTMTEMLSLHFHATRITLCLPQDPTATSSGADHGLQGRPWGLKAHWDYKHHFLDENTVTPKDEFAHHHRLQKTPQAEAMAPARPHPHPHLPTLALAPSSPSSPPSSSSSSSFSTSSLSRRRAATAAAAAAAAATTTPSSSAPSQSATTASSTSTAPSKNTYTHTTDFHLGNLSGNILGNSNHKESSEYHQDYWTTRSSRPLDGGYSSSTSSASSSFTSGVKSSSAGAAGAAGAGSSSGSSISPETSSGSASKPSHLWGFSLHSRGTECFSNLQSLEYDPEPLLNEHTIDSILKAGKTVVLTREYNTSATTKGGRRRSSGLRSLHTRHTAQDAGSSFTDTDPAEDQDHDREKVETNVETPHTIAGHVGTHEAEAIRKALWMGTPNPAKGDQDTGSESSRDSEGSYFPPDDSVLSKALGDSGTFMPTQSKAGFADFVQGLNPTWSQSPAPSPNIIKEDPTINPFFFQPLESYPTMDDDTFDPPDPTTDGGTSSASESRRGLESRPRPMTRSLHPAPSPLAQPQLPPQAMSNARSLIHVPLYRSTDHHNQRYLPSDIRHHRPPAMPVGIVSFLSDQIPYPPEALDIVTELNPFLANQITNALRLEDMIARSHRWGGSGSSMGLSDGPRPNETFAESIQRKLSETNDIKTPKPLDEAPNGRTRRTFGTTEQGVAQMDPLLFRKQGASPPQVQASMDMETSGFSSLGELDPESPQSLQQGHQGTPGSSTPTGGAGSSFSLSSPKTDHQERDKESEPPVKQPETCYNLDSTTDEIHRSLNLLNLDITGSATCPLAPQTKKMLGKAHRHHLHHSPRNSQSYPVEHDSWKTDRRRADSSSMLAETDSPEDMWQTVQPEDEEGDHGHGGFKSEVKSMSRSHSRGAASSDMDPMGPGQEPPHYSTIHSVSPSSGPKRHLFSTSKRSGVRRRRKSVKENETKASSANSSLYHHHRHASSSESPVPNSPFTPMVPTFASQGASGATLHPDAYNTTAFSPDPSPLTSPTMRHPGMFDHGFSAMRPPGHSQRRSAEATAGLSQSLPKEELRAPLSRQGSGWSMNSDDTSVTSPGLYPPMQHPSYSHAHDKHTVGGGSGSRRHAHHHKKKHPGYSSSSTDRFGSQQHHYHHHHGSHHVQQNSNSSNHHHSQQNPFPRTRLLRLIVDAISHHVFTLSPQTGYLTWLNQRSLQYAGTPLSQLLHTSWTGLLHQDDRMTFQPLFKECFDRGEMFNAQYRVRRFDGQYRWFLGRILPVRDCGGNIVHWFGTSTDIHDQKLAELQLNRQVELEVNEKKYRLLAEAIPQIVFTAAPQIGLTFANGKWFTYSGQTFEQAVGLGFMDHVHPEDRAKCFLPTHISEEDRSPPLMTTCDNEPPTPLMQSPGTSSSSSFRQSTSPGTGFGQSFPGEVSYQTELRLKRKDGKFRWFLVKCISVEVVEQGRKWFGTCTDINDHKLLEHKLKEAHDAAQKSTESKTRFLSNMSHEIRTPLVGITGMINFLITTELTSEQLDYVHTVQQSADALLLVINDILDLSKVEAGMMKLEMEPFSVHAMIEGANELLSTLAIQKGLELGFLVEDEVPEVVVGDRVRLRQVLINIIGNAIKFTTRGEVFTRCSLVQNKPSTAAITDVSAGFESTTSTTTILPTSGSGAATAAAGNPDTNGPVVPEEVYDPDQLMIKFEVSDTGKGFDESERAVMFKPFSQVDTSSTRKHGGTGLGLVLSKEFVELHGGKISCESVKGEGSKFSFTFLSRVPPPDVTARATTPLEMMEEVNGKVVNEMFPQNGRVGARNGINESNKDLHSMMNGKVTGAKVAATAAQTSATGVRSRTTSTPSATPSTSPAATVTGSGSRTGRESKRLSEPMSSLRHVTGLKLIPGEMCLAEPDIESTRKTASKAFKVANKKIERGDLMDGPHAEDEEDDEEDGKVVSGTELPFSYSSTLVHAEAAAGGAAGSSTSSQLEQPSKSSTTEVPVAGSATTTQQQGREDGVTAPSDSPPGELSTAMTRAESILEDRRYRKVGQLTPSNPPLGEPPCVAIIAANLPNRAADMKLTLPPTKLVEGRAAAAAAAAAAALAASVAASTPGTGANETRPDAIRSSDSSSSTSSNFSAGSMDSRLSNSTAMSSSGSLTAPVIGAALANGSVIGSTTAGATTSGPSSAMPVTLTPEALAAAVAAASSAEQANHLATMNQPLLPPMPEQARILIVADFLHARETIVHLVKQLVPKELNPLMDVATNLKEGIEFLVGGRSGASQLGKGQKYNYLVFNLAEYMSLMDIFSVMKQQQNPTPVSSPYTNGGSNDKGKEQASGTGAGGGGSGGGVLVEPNAMTCVITTPIQRASLMEAVKVEEASLEIVKTSGQTVGKVIPAKVEWVFKPLTKAKLYVAFADIMAHQQQMQWLQQQQQQQLVYGSEVVGTGSEGAGQNGVPGGASGMLNPYRKNNFDGSGALLDQHGQPVGGGSSNGRLGGSGAGLLGQQQQGYASTSSSSTSLSGSSSSSAAVTSSLVPTTPTSAMTPHSLGGRGIATAAGVRRPTAQQVVVTQKEIFSQMHDDMAGKNIRILLAEDDLVNQKVIRRYFQVVGAELVIANDGIECLEKFKGYPAGYFSLVLCDLFMPGKDGYETTRAIREWEDQQAVAEAKASGHEDEPVVPHRIPIVALSANVMANVAEQCLNSGFTSYLSKPVDFGKLGETLRKLVL